MFWNVFDQQYMYTYTNSNNSILDYNSASICSNNYLFYVDRWLIKEEECIFKFAIMKKIYTTLSNGWAPRDSSWSFSFWAVQLAEISPWWTEAAWVNARALSQLGSFEVAELPSLVLKPHVKHWV